jgi:phosphatidylethanolamine/phosphatidyl-N-methylethanolamine N-methyltransferase
MRPAPTPSGSGTAPSGQSLAAITRIYDRWAPLYDLVFGRLFDHPRRAAISAADRAGARVLEVGVGTGLSLPLYRAASRVVGIDISEAMLERARGRVAALDLAHVEDLRVMDAQALGFDDASFDVVTAQYVVNTVPDADAALDEFVRVLRPGGELIVVNRIGAEGGLRLTVERLLQPVVRRLGWQSQFPWARFETWLQRTPSMRLIERRAMPPLGHFALLRFGKARETSGPSDRAVAEPPITGRRTREEDA